MGVSTKNVIIDHAEIPNNPYQAPMYQPIRATNTEVRPRMPSGCYWALLGFGALLSIALIYFGWRFAEYMGDLNYRYREFDSFLINVVKVALAGGIVGAIMSGVYWAINKARLAGIVRMPNGVPIAAYDVASGYVRPVARNFAAATLTQHYTVEGARAQNPLGNLPGLSTLDLSAPAQKFGTNTTLALDAPDDDVTEPPALPDVPEASTMIATLIGAGLVARSGDSINVGFAAGVKPSYVELDECGFLGLGGMPRVGKSNTAAYVIAQLLLTGADVVLCDKHANRPDSLTGRLGALANRLARSAHEPQDIIDAIDYWYEIGSNRMAQGNGPAKYKRVVLVIDEFTGMILMEQLPPATLAKMTSSAVEFAKVQVHGIVIGHQWTGKLIGGPIGAALRRVLTHRFVMRLDPRDAEYLIPGSYAKAAFTLPAGRALYMDSDGVIAEVTVPHMTQADFAYLDRIVPSTPALYQPSSVIHSQPPESSQPERGKEADQPSSWDISKREALAKVLLSKRDGSRWLYRLDQVARLCSLRNERVVELAHDQGRKGRVAS